MQDKEKEKALERMNHVINVSDYSKFIVDLKIFFIHDKSPTMSVKDFVVLEVLETLNGKQTMIFKVKSKKFPSAKEFLINSKVWGKIVDGGKCPCTCGWLKDNACKRWKPVEFGDKHCRCRVSDTKCFEYLPMNCSADTIICPTAKGWTEFWHKSIDGVRERFDTALECKGLENIVSQYVGKVQPNCGNKCILGPPFALECCGHSI